RFEKGRGQAAGQAGAGYGECTGAYQQHQQAMLQNVHSQPRGIAKQLGAGKPGAVHGQVPCQLGRGIAGVRGAGNAREPV
ncbi:hypothetical protein GGI20_006385, partial [Coemansia sp. BCRC 34301]